jgi:ComF family protein
MALIDLLLPPSCAGCGTYGVALCDRCLGAMRPAGRPEDRFLAADPGIVVGEVLEVGVAAFAYEGPLRRMLSKLKYVGVRRLADPLAGAAVAYLDPLLALVRPQALVPVPIHADRRRERGYNQAALLAEALSRRCGVPAAELLERRRMTAQQHRLSRAARLRNLRDAFGLLPQARPPPTVMLIDDILTTSATLEACAAVLLAGGATRVWGFALAREV